MINLAIQGHATRGKEVIEILKMLGGINIENCYGIFETRFYLINASGDIEDRSLNDNSNYQLYTLEEFLEKYPYKVGDRVKTIYGKIGIVSKPIWSNRDDCIRYELEADTDSFYFVNELQPYKEETMKEELISRIDFDKYCKDKYLLNLGNYEIKEENGKTYAVRKQFEYPKTYEECCEILMGKTNFQDFSLVLTKLSANINEENSISPDPPHITLINNFYKLLICRNAYWKIAGEQMGLGKPWEPDWLNVEQDKFVLYTHDNVICSNCFVLGHNVLAFPTEEMRDVFYENFKNEIEQCKELL